MDKGSQNVFRPSKFLSAWRGGNSVKEGTTTVFDSRGYSSVTLKGPVWTKQYKVHVDIWICMGLAQGCFQKGRRKSLVFQCFQKDQQQRLRRIWIKEVKTCKNGNDFWRPGMTSKAACLHQLWFLAPAVRCISCRSSSTWCVPGPRTLPSSCQSRSSAWRFSIPQFGFASRICSTCFPTTEQDKRHFAGVVLLVDPYHAVFVGLNPKRKFCAWKSRPESCHILRLWLAWHRCLLELKLVLIQTNLHAKQVESRCSWVTNDEALSTSHLKEKKLITRGKKKRKISPCENPNSRGELQYKQTAPKTEPSIKSKSAKHKTQASFRTSIWTVKNVWWNL